MEKDGVWFAHIHRKGRPTAEIVAEILEHVIRNFPWPKSMRWGAGNLRWVRPLHSILCLLSDESAWRRASEEALLNAQRFHWPQCSAPLIETMRCLQGVPR